MERFGSMGHAKGSGKFSEAISRAGYYGAVLGAALIGPQTALAQNTSNTPILTTNASFEEVVRGKPLGTLTVNGSEVEFNCGEIGADGSFTNIREGVMFRLMNLLTQSEVTCSGGQTNFLDIGDYSTWIGPDGKLSSPWDGETTFQLRTNNSDAQNINFTGTSSIPEPATYAIMLAGLGVVGANRKRKTQGGSTETGGTGKADSKTA